MHEPIWQEVKLKYFLCRWFPLCVSLHVGVTCWLLVVMVSFSTLILLPGNVSISEWITKCFGLMGKYYKVGKDYILCALNPFLLEKRCVYPNALFFERMHLILGNTGYPRWGGKYQYMQYKIGFIWGIYFVSMEKVLPDFIVMKDFRYNSNLVPLVGMKMCFGLKPKEI